MVIIEVDLKFQFLIGKLRMKLSLEEIDKCVSFQFLIGKLRIKEV